MTYTAPNHYSYKYKFNVEKLPTEQTDKLPRKITWWGMFGGLMFVILGLFEIVAYFLQMSDESYNFSTPQRFSAEQLFIFRYSFDTFILVLGLLMIILSAVAMVRCKKVFFDGETVKVEHHPLFGKPIVETDHLYNYLGVLLKVEYYQVGLINRNRYIIELYHKEKNKRIPLYISTSGDGVRKIWEYYAEKLKMPALFMTDHGLVSRHYNELNKTLKEMSKRWHLNALYREEDHMPASIQYKNKKGKVVLKERSLYFDVYTILASLSMLMLIAGFVALLMYYPYVIPYIGVLGVITVLLLCFMAIMFISFGIFSKDVLVITKNEVVLGHNVSFLRTDVEFLPKEDIESVDIGHNPITDRYYLSIISHDNNIVFGKNMPIEDLRWIRGCVIREIVK